MALLIRVGYILSANTIGELTQELLYLRMDALRVPLLTGLAGLVFEIVEFVYTLLVFQGAIDASTLPNMVLYLNALQSVSFLTAGAFLYATIRPYSPAGIEERIEENMETIALLGGTRRRRRTGDRGEARSEVRRERVERETRRERGERRERDTERDRRAPKADERS